MEAAELPAAPRRSAGRWLSGFFTRHPRLAVGGLLAGPLGWLVVGYLGSLAVLLAASFWNVNAITGEVQQTFTGANFKTIVTEPVFRTVALRTVLDAMIDRIRSQAATA